MVPPRKLGSVKYAPPCLSPTRSLGPLNICGAGAGARVGPVGAVQLSASVVMMPSLNFERVLKSPRARIIVPLASLSIPIVPASFWVVFSELYNTVMLLFVVSNLRILPGLERVPPRSISTKRMPPLPSATGPSAKPKPEATFSSAAFR